MTQGNKKKVELLHILTVLKSVASHFRLWPQGGQQTATFVSQNLFLCYVSDLFLVYAALVGIYHVYLLFSLL